MEKTSSQKTTRDVLSVIGGSVSGGIIFILLVYLFFLVGLLGWTDGGSQEEMVSLEKQVNLSFLVILALTGFAAGVITIIISVSKKISLSIITAVILILIYVISNDTPFVKYDVQDCLRLLMLVSACLLGAALIINKKRRPVSEIPDSDIPH